MNSRLTKQLDFFGGCSNKQQKAVEPAIVFFSHDKKAQRQSISLKAVVPTEAAVRWVADWWLVGEFVDGCCCCCCCCCCFDWLIGDDAVISWLLLQALQILISNLNHKPFLNQWPTNWMVTNPSNQPQPTNHPGTGPTATSRSAGRWKIGVMYPEICEKYTPIIYRCMAYFLGGTC